MCDNGLSGVATSDLNARTTALRLSPRGHAQKPVTEGDVKKLPYYRMYPADADTDENHRGLTDAELGLFTRCLNHAWVNGGIPADIDALARVIPKATKASLRKLWPAVSKCFRTSEENSERLVNSRQETERALACEKSELARKSVKARWGDDTNVSETYDDRMPNVMPRAGVRADSDSVYDSESSKKEEPENSQRAQARNELRPDTSVPPSAEIGVPNRQPGAAKIPGKPPNGHQGGSLGGNRLRCCSKYLGDGTGCCAVCLFPEIDHKKTPAPENFEAFWSAYPNQVRKNLAAQAWVDDPVRGESNHVAIMACLERWKASQEWSDGCKSHPANWLRAEAADGFSSKPPPAKKAAKQETAADILTRMAGR